MDLDLIKLLRESSLRSASDFVNVYTSNEEEILKTINDFTGIKSEFYCNDFYNSLDTIKFLSIYSDITSVFMLPNRVKDHLIHYYPPEDPKFINRNITFTAETLNGFVPKPNEILPAYTTQNNDDLKELFLRLKPLIDQGKFLVRPIRTIILENHPFKNETDRMIYYAASDTPNDDWQVKSLNEKNSYVIDNGLKNYQSQVLYEITLPYLNNLSIENLTKIINEESDLLGSFRSALKDLMMSSVNSDKVSLNQIRNDKIRPQIETINRKFKIIKNIHNCAIGTSLIAYTISLIAITNNVGVNFQTLFNSTLGSVGFLASEIRYKTEEDKLKDNPYFLLWKISKSNTSKILNQF